MTRFATLLAGAATALVLGTAANAADPDLTVLDWAGWEIDGMLQPYVDKNGQKPSYVFFADDDEAFQKVSSGFKADVVHPCASSFPRYKNAGLIEPWDVSKIPAVANIPDRMKKNFTDDQGLWFIATDYAYTAIAYNKDEVPEADVATLQVFTDPKYAGRISLPNNTDDVWALALLATGVTSWDNVTDDQFKAAADWLRKVHPNVRAYWADPSELSQLMASGEILVAWSWNDPVAILLAENFPVGFNRSPTEGATTWFCGFVNMKDGPGKEGGKTGHGCSCFWWASGLPQAVSPCDGAKLCDGGASHKSELRIGFGKGQGRRTHGREQGANAGDGAGIAILGAGRQGWRPDRICPP